MKYIDAEQLKAEIERYENTAIDAYNPHGEDADFWHGKVVAYEDMKEFIDYIQQEQSEVNINKEIDELWESLNTGHDYVIVDSYQDFLGICLHCFELGLNARKKE